MTDKDDRAAVRFPPPLVFVLAMAAGAFADRWLPGLPLPALAGATRIAGLVVLAGGLALASWALAQFVRSGQNPEPWKPTPSLETGGIYRFTRNPMYLGMALIHAGLGLYLRDGWILVTMPVAALLVERIAIRPEEAYLAAKFGPAYEEYRRRVRRWL